MRSEQRFEALATADAHALETLADEILAGGVDVQSPPDPNR